MSLILPGVHAFMSSQSETELQAIVRLVIQQTLAEAASAPAQPPSPSNPPAPSQAEAASQAARKSVAIGADHGGFEMKESLKVYLGELGYTLIDCGTKDKTPVDYPDFALAVALQVSQGKAWRGIVVDGAGIGSCIVANKVPGVRASLCYDHATAVNSREHNDANLLTLGASLIGDGLARQIVNTWLSTAFLGGRHARRVEKITAVEHQFMKSGS
jgi:ribose 5-phosphate isomerase B